MKIKVRVEHRLGEVLAKTVKRGGDRKSEKSNTHNGSLIPVELGTPKQRQHASSRTQQWPASRGRRSKKPSTRRPRTTKRHHNPATITHAVLVALAELI